MWLSVMPTCSANSSIPRRVPLVGPGEAYAICPGFAFAAATNSLRVFAGKSAFTITATVKRPVNAIGAKSAIGSYGSLG